MATFSEQLAADVTGVLLNTSEFAETVIHYPLGNRDAGVSRTADVDLDNEAAGTPDTVQDDGERIVRMGKLELPVSVTVNVAERSVNRDTFLIGDELWFAVRLLGVDAWSQTVEIQRAENITTKKSRLKP